MVQIDVPDANFILVLRKVHKLGPVSMYLRLLADWKERPGFDPRKIADKTKRFFRFYSVSEDDSPGML